MDTSSLIFLLIGSLGGLILGMIVLLVLQVRNAMRVDKLTSPVYEYALAQAQKDAQLIVSKAQEQAHSITTEAEKTGQQTIAKYTESAQKAHEVYIETIEQFTKELSEKLNASSQDGAHRMETLMHETVDAVAAQKKQLEERFGASVQLIESLPEQIQKRVDDALMHAHDEIKTTTQRLTEQLQKEDESYRTYIDQHLHEAVTHAESQIALYQKAREEILDQHIEKLVEDVVAQVLLTQLSSEEHAQLARAALNEAKESNIL